MRSLASYIRVLVITGLAYLFLELTVSTTTGELAIVEYPVIWAVLGILLIFGIAMEVVLASIQSILFRSLTPEAQERYIQQTAAKKNLQFAKIKAFFKKLNKSKPVEEEGEIILDHNYDGIQELDNDLPPWWIYLFYVTIVFAGVYLVRHHLFNAPNQHEEYIAEVQEAKKAIEEYKKTAKDLIDANTVELLTGEEDVKAGAAIFAGNCIACHKADAGGGIGPNLTDDYWINGGGIKNVFHTISEGGRPGKGMVAWKTDLKPSEIAQVASYVISLHGTTPADPKDPQGELWVDENAPVEDVEVTKTDSTSVEVIIKDEPVTD
ncbi:cbb3-type cytochrome c oxidase N-terminal domain-containing protein [Zunongwangia sp.]|uniref:cbb3-type cytochrome c oxidase N-terminal domain-containing protein n=1 Tax=Zunongwangia sp. TaxID=1965325 RepID=UPI003AA914E8